MYIPTGQENRKQFKCAQTKDSYMLGMYFFSDNFDPFDIPESFHAVFHRFQGEAHDGSIRCAQGGPKLPTADLSISGHAATEVVFDLGGGAS